MDPDATISPVISNSPLNPARRTLLIVVGAGALAGTLASLVESESTDAKKKKGKRKKKGGKGKGKKRCTGRVNGGASASEETQLLDLINQFRQDNDVLPPLTRNPQLDSAALTHSQDMARRCYFDHISPEGTDPFDRMETAGYTGAPRSENIYVGTGPYKSAAEAFDGWKTSTSGHREAMLDAGADEIGIGTALDGSGAMYWTNVFGEA